MVVVVGAVWLGVEAGAFCSLRGDRGLGKGGEGSPGPPDTGPGGGSSTSGKPGIEAHFPAWWAVLALKSPAWAAPSTMNFLKSFEIPWSLLVPGRAGTDRGGQEEGLGEAVGRAILGAGPWPASDSGSRLENQGWEGFEVWEALGLQLPS